jgi:hypothetical protein
LDTTLSIWGAIEKNKFSESFFMSLWGKSSDATLYEFDIVSMIESIEGICRNADLCDEPHDTKCLYSVELEYFMKRTSTRSYCISTHWISEECCNPHIES